jgi:hypothetical protein
MRHGFILVVMPIYKMYEKGVKKMFMSAQLIANLT